jgi:hypothetical protein
VSLLLSAFARWQMVGGENFKLTGSCSHDCRTQLQ